MINGLKGIQITVDKFGCIGKVSDVVIELERISSTMKEPYLLRLGDSIAVFDLHIPETSIEISKLSYQFKACGKELDMNSPTRNGL